MLDAGKRQDGVIYKPNTAKNHQNTRSWPGRIATPFALSMKAERFDFLVIGSTPAARLVAGLLASTHGKKVAWKGESQSGYRLQRGIDLSIAPVTRPETWSLVRTCLPEVTRLVSRIAGRRAWSSVDPVLLARSAGSKEALAHLRHMATGFGHEAERLPSRLLGPDADVLVVRDAALLDRGVLEPPFDLWLERHKVYRVPPETVIDLGEDGSAGLNGPDHAHFASQTILADDEAVLHHLPPATWPNLLLRQAHSTVLMHSAHALMAPVMLELGTGLQLTQQGNGIRVHGPGTIDMVAGLLGGLMSSRSTLCQAGQSHYHSLASADGAPLAGAIGGSGPIVLSGFGSLAAFLAPSIARWLAKAASNAEGAWFSQRSPDRTASGSMVADWGGAG